MVVGNYDTDRLPHRSIPGRRRINAVTSAQGAVYEQSASPSTRLNVPSTRIRIEYDTTRCRVDLDSTTSVVLAEAGTSIVARRPYRCMVMATVSGKRRHQREPWAIVTTMRRCGVVAPDVVTSAKPGRRNHDREPA